MAVLHLVQPLSGVFSSSLPPTGLRLRAVCSDRDGHAVHDLAVAALAVPAADAGPQPRAAGLVAELASRTGRRVEAWLAVCDSDGDDRTLGLVTLVESQACAARHSLGWLLVHPGARRRGVGRLLVTEACQRVRQLGGDRVWVEVRREWSGAVAFWRAMGFAEPVR